MFIQIHALQSFPPGNLNRDDRGHPKSALFGGVTRGRISSQCMKRRMRKSDAFETLQNGIGVRTRRLPALVGESLVAASLPGMSADLIKRIEARIASAFKKDTGAEAVPDESDEATQTGQLVFFPRKFAERIAAAVEALFTSDKAQLEKWIGGAKKKGKDAKEAEAVDDKADKISPLNKTISDASKLISIDIGMFGRMTTSELVEDIEAACQVAHALSTHEVRIESDYFTTMDDLSTGPGAGFVGGGDTSTYFNSAVYYRYINLDLRQLSRTVKLDGTGDEGARMSQAQLADAACALLNAMVYAGPTAKQNSFAAHSVPELLIVQISERRVPLSYANAFLLPVPLAGDTSLMARSAERLRDHVDQVASRFEPTDLRRLVLAVGAAAGDFTGAKSVGRYEELEDALRREISAIAVAGVS